MAFVRKTFLAFLFACVVTCGCSTIKTEVDPSKLKEVESVWATLPAYPGMTEVSNSVSSYDGRAWVERNYKSDAPFDDVKRFYTKTLTSIGWRLVGEREVKDRGRFKGERLLEFRQGDFELDVQYSGARKADLGWDYSVDVTSP